VYVQHVIKRCKGED